MFGPSFVEVFDINLFICTRFANWNVIKKSLRGRFKNLMPSVRPLRRGRSNAGRFYGV